MATIDTGGKPQDAARPRDRREMAEATSKRYLLETHERESGTGVTRVTPQPPESTRRQPRR